MKRAIFPGTFDPFTLGHYALVVRALELFDNIVIAIGNNAGKKTMFSVEQRISIIKACFKDNSRIEVCSYEGLTSDLAKSKDINFLLRGIRSLNDFEYEKTLADVNLKIASIETVCLFSEPQYSFIQSMVVRDIIIHGHRLDGFVHPDSIELINQYKK
jgi:pantetheine-phosphate adenylyltransferase